MFTLILPLVAYHIQPIITEANDDINHPITIIDQTVEYTSKDLEEKK